MGVLVIFIVAALAVMGIAMARWFADHRKQLPPQQRIDRALADIDTRIARIERQLFTFPPAPTKPVRVRIVWCAPEGDPVC